MQPFRLKSVCKDYLWGGEQLKAWGKGENLDRVAESWELAAHPDGESTVLDGPFAGWPLSRLALKHPEAVLPGFQPGSNFPLMVKLIDAKQSLSIQVHPDNEYAARMEGGQGKTEMWYVLDHTPGAFLYLGFEKKIGREELANAISEGMLTGLLRRFDVRRGDSFFIPAGTIHAIGGGILLVEIQENSNITYRVFDYNRLGTDGKPRSLHVEKALAVVRREPPNPAPPGAKAPCAVQGGTLEVMVRCPQFRAGILRLDGRWESAPGKGFLSLLCLKGSAVLSHEGVSLEAERGTSLFVPADAGPFALTSGREGAEFLLTAPDGTS
ncbi:MAG: class I mannose-6-phosphate isomerase [Fretibacterium sp.]|nr:class I mannose-6-phosphate isomerase [Fretibacterium sp.]